MQVWPKFNQWNVIWLSTQNQQILPPSRTPTKKTLGMLFGKPIITPPQGVGGITPPVGFIEGLGNGLDILANTRVPNLIENFVLTGKQYTPGNIPGGVEGLQFSKGSSDGRHFYIYDKQNNVVRQFDMPISYDLDTAVDTIHAIDISVINPFITETDFDLSNDGKQFFVCGFHDPVTELTSLGLPDNPWQFIGNPVLGPTFIFPNLFIISFTFSTDGTRLFTLSVSNPRKIRQYNLSTPFDITTIVYSGIEFDLPVQVSNARNIRISINGVHMFVSDDTADSVFRFSFGIPNDLSTMDTTPGGELDTSLEENITTGLGESQDNTKLCIIGTQNKTVIEYEAPLELLNIEVIPWVFNQKIYQNNL